MQGIWELAWKFSKKFFFSFPNKLVNSKVARKTPYDQHLSSPRCQNLCRMTVLQSVVYPYEHQSSIQKGSSPNSF